MKIRTLALLSCLILSIKVYGQAAMVPTVNSMTNNDLWTALTTVNASGETIFGKCRVAVATSCGSCACDYYFRANVPGSLGYYGWPKNPSSGDSTGCLGNGCWGGYTAAMCTSDIKANARAMLLDALNKSACGNPVPPNVSGGVNLSDVSKFFFVDPKENDGKIECGTIGLGTAVGQVNQFTQLPSSLCRAAYQFSTKALANGKQGAKFITKAQLNQNTLSNSEIQNAASMVGQLNESYALFSLGDLQKFLDYSDAQYAAMSTAEVALFYVAVTQNSNLLPDALKPRVIVSKFSETRTATDNWIIQSEIDAAVIKIAQLKSGEVSGKGFTLEQAYEYFKTSQTAP